MVTDATMRASHYPDVDALEARVFASVTAHNFAKYLKALRWRTPFNASDAWIRDSAILKINPHHLIPGPDT